MMIKCSSFKAGVMHFCAAISVAAFVLVADLDRAHADNIRAAERGDFGRLVFDWDEPVRYAAEVVGDTLVVQFERPVLTDIAESTQTLNSYVTGGRFAPDRRSIFLPLRPGVSMRTFTVRNAVVVDLVGPENAAEAVSPVASSQSSAPSSAPRPLANASSEPGLPTVPVRTGQHPDYFRMAFDWPSQTAYRVERRGDTLAVVFNDAAAIDAANVDQRLPDAHKGAAVSRSGSDTIFTFPFSSQKSVRDFTNGNTIVVDLLDTPPTVQVAQQQTAPSSAQPAPAQATQAQSNQQSQAAASTPSPRSQTPSAEAIALTDTVREATQVDASGQRVTRAAVVDDAQVDPLTARPAEVSLTIPWTEPAAAAVFRRAEYLWVVFDRYKQVDVQRLAQNGAPYITFVEQLPYRNNTILRMVTRPDVNPTTRRDGLDWILDFRSSPMRPTRAIEITAQIDRPSPNLYLPVTEGGRTVAVEDPEVGDYLLVVPVIPLSYGVYPGRSFTDLDMPVTAQGVVVIPKSDGVRAQAMRTGIEVDVDGGMALSRALADVSNTLGGDPNMQRILNIADWQIGNADNYTRNKQALQFALGDQRPEVREEARFRLGRFEFVNERYPETLAILRVMASEESDIENTAPFRALRGAANMMMLRYEEAAEDFNHFSLANEDDARFWLAAARAKFSDPAAQAQVLMQTGSLIRSYPRRVKIPLALTGVEAAIAAGDDFGAQGFLDLIRRENPTPTERAAIDYMDGKLNEKIGELQVALQQYRKAEDSDGLLYQVLGRRDRMELENRLGTLSTDELIEGLEQLRYRWRGDEIEFDLLLRLADLYIAQQDYGTALRRLKITTSYFTDDPQVDEAADKMANVYEELYLNGAADELSPVTAIALFQEFRSLVPPGAEGDEMIRKLADRLVAVDLLPQAALLLERQIQFRVTGVDRSRIGARLALVYLLNMQPEQAIDTLRDTQNPESSRELNAQRRRLEARALTDLNKVDEAILLLGTDTTPETRQLRAEIYWRAQDWDNAARALSELVPEPDAGSLGQADARLVLDWATALTLAGDERTLVRVRQRYAAPMANTAFQEAFTLITTPRERGILDIASVRQQIEQAENFQSFMVEYRDMLGNNSLSAIN